MISQSDFVAILERRTGLTLESLGGQRSLSLAMRRCAAEAGFEQESEWRDAAAHSPSLWADFVHAVIVPETFFFRYPESFQALKSWAMRVDRFPLRILCLPCSTGEEAYSIAITLREAGLPSEDFSILAVDIDGRSVQRAEAGEYFRASALRTPPGTMLRSYWRDFSDGRLIIDKSLKVSIRFRTQNLWDIPGDQGVFDVIFCRNLLIYFSEDNQKAALGKIDQLLHPSGILFLGPAEMAVAGKFGWRSTGYPMAFSCQRGEKIQATCQSLLRRTISRPKSSIVTTGRSSLPPNKAPVPPRVPTLNDVRTLADRGASREAQHALQEFQKHSPNDADALALDGVLSENVGDSSRAEACFRQAIYLNPDHVEAMTHLAFLLEAEGRLGAARKLRERVERISIR